VAAILAIIFLLQGIPVQQGGRVTGMLRDSQGVALPGVRMAAVARGASLEETATGVAMAGLAETDAQGRFTLEDIPPGRYSIAAGRLDLQTYYPGTQSLADARIFTVAAGQTISDIDFVLNSTSIGRSSGTTNVVRITATIPVRVTVENGGRLPVSVDTRSVNLRLDLPSSSLSIPIEGSAFVVPGPVTGVARVAVENLPDFYEVKSITYGSRVIAQGSFELTASNFPTISGRTPTAVNAVPSPSPAPTTPVQAALSSLEAAFANYVQARAAALLSAGLLALSPASLVPTTTPPSSLVITLGEAARPASSGVRVSGNTGNKDLRGVYISGRPGVVFSDGTFEFREVPPGRHVIAALAVPERAATMIIVGDKDVYGVQLRGISMFPEDVRVPKDPLPAGELAPGTTVPLPRIVGTVLEETLKAPVTAGELDIRSGELTRTISIDEKGRFETFALVPGTYEIHVKVFGHSASSQSVVVVDKDIDLIVTTRRLY
jgi:hypothetical protein